MKSTSVQHNALLEKGHAVAGVCATRNSLYGQSQVKTTRTHRTPQHVHYHITRVQRTVTK